MDDPVVPTRSWLKIANFLNIKFFMLLCGVGLATGTWIYYSKYNTSMVIVEDLDTPIVHRNYYLKKTEPPTPKRHPPAWTKQFREELDADLKKAAADEAERLKFRNQALQTGKVPVLNNTGKIFEGIENSSPRKRVLDTMHPIIVCMIFTTPQSWTQRGLAVRLTWARRCDYPIFFYSKDYGIIPEEEGKEIPVIPLPIPEGREHLTAKSMLGLEWAYRHYAQHADWYLKCDDDSYFIMENLQDFLSVHNSSEPYYIGRKINNILVHGYNSGGAGYALSKGAARLLVDDSYKHSNVCMSDGTLEDVDLGRCLEYFKVYPVETMDKNMKLTFHSDNPLEIMEARRDDLVKNYYFKKEEARIGNPHADHILSPFGISFHYVTPAQMYMYDYLLYEVRLKDNKHKKAHKYNKT